MSALTADERETIVRWSDGEPEVRVWSASPREIAKLRKDERFLEIGSEKFTDGGESAEFVIDKGEFVLVQAARRRMSADERAKRAGTLFGSPTLFDSPIPA